MGELYRFKEKTLGINSQSQLQNIVKIFIGFYVFSIILVAYGR